MANTLEQRNSIRVALIGCVSSGKSTLLNSICVNEYEDMKRKRTTMLPSVYKGSNTAIHKNQTEINRIKERNQELNTQFYEVNSLTKETCKLQEHIIPKVDNFINLHKDVYLDIYDIPGLNDSKTKEVYFSWVRDNFHEFDIVINVVNIENGMNTSDETDILELLNSCMLKEKQEFNRNVLLLTAINKCDDMDFNKHGRLTLPDEEDQEMFEQIVKTTTEKMKSGSNELSHLVKFSPITARDTYIYRTLSQNPSFELDMTLLNKFGLNEFGKKTWNRLSLPQKRKCVKEHFSDDTNDTETTLEMTGYTNFKNILNKYLTLGKQSKILTARLRQELMKKENLNKNITKDTNEMKQLIKIYNNYCVKIKTVDTIYKTNHSKLITELISTHIYRWINDISDLSNDKQESIERLEEYKSIIELLDESVDRYALKNKVNLDIKQGSEKRWSDSFGFSIKTADIGSDKSPRFTLSKVFENLYKGYSSLQNDYYEKKLQDKETYREFPKHIFENVDKLRQNRCDNVEDIFDMIISNVLLGIEKPTGQPKSLIDLVDGPHMGYVSSETNCIQEFCHKLLSHYDYPKDKIIKFLQTYIMDRYALYMSSGGAFMDNPINKSYTIMLDEWLSYESPQPTIEMVSSFWWNLKLVNKSYTYKSNLLDPSINYMEHKQKLLCLPMYLSKLSYGEKDTSE